MNLSCQRVDPERPLVSLPLPSQYIDTVRVYSEVWNDIKTAKMSYVINGIAWFEFMDEWWKPSDPNVIPSESDPTTHEDNDPEEWFGIFSIRDDRSLAANGGLDKKIKELFSQ